MTMRPGNILRNGASALIAAVIFASPGQAFPQSAAPGADHHTHLRSPADAEFIARNFQGQALVADGSRVLSAADLIAVMDASGVRKAAVLSTAYFFGMSGRPKAAARDEYRRVRGENDWTARQVARYPRRLVGFCSVNPLKAYAVREIRRCKKVGFSGLKLHFSNSDVDLRNREHLDRLKAVFAAANESRFALIVHLRTHSKNYGAGDVRAFIGEVLPAAPDVPVQIAHMAGWGGYDRATDEAVGAFVEEMRRGRLGRGHLYFDLSGVLLPRRAYEARPGSDLRTLAESQRGFSGWESRLVRRMRELGPERVLFATDWPVVTPAEYRAILREQLGLGREEEQLLYSATAPYLE